MNIISLLAATCTSQDGKTTIDTYFTWVSGDDCGILALILVIFNWVAVGVGTIVLLMIIVGAIRYMTARGSADQAKKGLDIIRNALMALGLYIAMWSLLNWLVPGGIFGT
jgi:uncharacterized membrane protein